MNDIIERLRSRNWRHQGTVAWALRDEAADEIERLTQELQNIVDADYRRWLEPMNTPDEFVNWAKSRARAAIARATGEQS